MCDYGNSAEILSQINKLQSEMADWFDKFGEITEEQYKLLMELAAQYNNAIIAEGCLTIDDYVTNGIITTDFEEKQDAVGKYQVNFHNGIDVVGGNLKSPFFLIATNGKEKGSNDKYFSVIGTNLKMLVKHGDKGSLRKSGDFYKPGDVIMPFPKNNNYTTASTAPHFHIELTNGKNFINPFTLKTSEINFKRTLDGGKTWKSIDPNYYY